MVYREAETEEVKKNSRTASATWPQQVRSEPGLQVALFQKRKEKDVKREKEDPGEWLQQ